MAHPTDLDDAVSRARALTEALEDAQSQLAYCEIVASEDYADVLSFLERDGGHPATVEEMGRAVSFCRQLAERAPQGGGLQVVPDAGPSSAPAPRTPKPGPDGSGRPPGGAGGPVSDSGGWFPLLLLLALAWAAGDSD
jgi:hypothetical protein